MADSGQQTREQDQPTNNRKEKRNQWWKERRNKAGKGEKSQGRIRKQREKVAGEQEIEVDHSPDVQSKKSNRFILFLGHLSYETTKEEVLQHFHKCGVAALDFRLLTEKSTNKSKGYGFLELKSAMALSNALKLNGTKIGSRSVKLEMSCGGGGKGSNRLNKIREKNHQMKLRQKLKQEQASAISS